MDLLSDILSRLQLSGTLYFRTSFTSPWSVLVPSFQNVARFHFAHKGRCLVRVGQAKDPVMLEQGDLIIIPRGATHTLFCDLTTENQAVMLDKVIEDSGYSGSGTLIYGELGTDHETQLVCGHFSFAKNAGHVLIDALPSHIHIRNYGEAAGQWMENTLRVIGSEAGRGGMGGDLIALKMSEIIFAQALRVYLNDEGADMPVLSGFADPNLSRVLTAVHKDPSYPWTLDNLAKVSGLSRTSFATRFVKRMTLTPMGYITSWRMQIASQQLTNTDDPIIKVAEDAGYKSEAAFSRVFKKYHSEAPATFRRLA
jgi:AraC-like DNA-binding protein